MKKTLIALVVFMAGYAVSAQETVIYKTSTSGTYNAYSIPAPIKINYEALYGDPALATWEPVSGMWHATIVGRDNRILHSYYSTEPWYLEMVPDNRDVNYKVALPVMNTFVPESVITSAISQHGEHIYSITKLSSGYQIGVLENGTLKLVPMNSSE